MKAGTILKFEDGRFGTVVYNGLDGVGIQWGERHLTQEEVNVLYGSNPLFGEDDPTDEILKTLYHDALLRKPWNGAKIECVDMDYEIYKEGFVCP